MDHIDIAILKELLNDCKQPIKQIADKVNLSHTPVNERIKRMEQCGIIQRYSAVLNPKSIDFNLIVFMQVKLKEHQKNTFKKLTDEIRTYGEILEAYFIAGEYDAIIKVLLKDMDDYNDFILERFSDLDVVDSHRTSFVVKSILNDNELPHLLTEKNIARL